MFHKTCKGDIGILGFWVFWYFGVKTVSSAWTEEGGQYGYSEKDIASTLKIHPYRVKLAIQNSRNYSKETLLNYLYNLAIIDIDIKTGKINKDLALELFILK